MTIEPWDREDSEVDFTAAGLRCHMARGFGDIWCGYVGVPPSHPWYGLPTNALVKFDPEKFKHRTLDQGVGIFDVFLHAVSGRKLEDGVTIAMALEVHGGVTWADDHAGGLDAESDGEHLWWFGFDCGHAGDYMPKGPRMSDFIDTMPPDIAKTMRKLDDKYGDGHSVYRTQQYVVAECQHLAEQLAQIADIMKEAVQAEEKK